MKVLLLLSFLLPSLLLGWEKYYGDTLHNEYCSGIVKDKDGNYLICYTNENRSNLDDEDIGLLKVDKSGVVIFNKVYNEVDCIDCSFLLNTKDEGYVISGNIFYKDKGFDIYLLKLDANYNKKWTNTIGLNKWNLSYSILETDNNDLIAIGFTEPKIGYLIGYFAKVDKYGNQLWEKTSAGLGESSFRSITKAKDGGYLITGGTHNQDEVRLYVIKIDDDGNTIWEKMFGNTGDDLGRWVESTNDGGYIITGMYSRDLCLLKLDANGNKEWEKTFSESNGESVKQDESENFVIVGSKGTTNPWNSDIYILKVDSQGNKIWDKTFGGSDTIEYGLNILIDPNEYYIAGNRYTETHGLDWDIYLVKTDKDGETGFSSYVSTKSLPSPSFSISPNPFSSRLSLSLSSSGAIYSLAGQLIMKLDKGKHSLDTSKWREGVYIVKAGKESRRIVKVN
ncbi:MAG: T9SS type A sorting domain-containing protein [Candidatus Coatesbacteria bacterium]|nr:T9SS type A sorting domain-containing protein [Candidatus Coatesbacteria bacterium]